MTEQQRKARPATQYGPTAAFVAANVQRLRKRRDLSIYQLSALLREAGRPITPAAVGKIERQQRQVTVDDLVTLAAVFRVSPSALLLPLNDNPDVQVEVTGAGAVHADRAWDWMDGHVPLLANVSKDPAEPYLEYLLDSRPPIRRAQEAARLREHLAELGFIDDAQPPARGGGN